MVASLLGSLVLAGSALCLGGCANLGYYWQSASGHVRMLQAARPVQEWLADATAPPFPDGAFDGLPRQPDFARLRVAVGLDGSIS